MPRLCRTDRIERVEMDDPVDGRWRWRCKDCGVLMAYEVPVPKGICKAFPDDEQRRAESKLSEV